MSTIIERYQLSFELARRDTNHPLALIGSTMDDLFDYQIGGYFIGQPIDFLTGDVLPEIEKALCGQPYESDGGGVICFLTIGTPISTFSAINELKSDVSIPTQDLKEIMIAWTDWVIANSNLHNNI